MAAPCRNCGGVVGACLAPDQPAMSGGENVIEFKSDGAGNTCLFVGSERIKGLAVLADEVWDPDVGLYGDPNLAEVNAAGQLFVKRPCLENLTMTRDAFRFTPFGLITIGEVQMNAVYSDSTRSTNPALSTRVSDSFGSRIIDVARTGIYSIETWMTLGTVAEGSSPFVSVMKTGLSLQSETGGPAFGLPRGAFPVYGNSFPNPSLSANGPPVSTYAWTGLLQRGEEIRGINYRVEQTTAGDLRLGNFFVSVTFIGPECD